MELLLIVEMNGNRLSAGSRHLRGELSRILGLDVGFYAALIDLLEQSVDKGLIVFVRVGDGLSRHEPLDLFWELINEVLRGEVTDLVSMNVFPPRTLLGYKYHIHFMVHGRLELLETPFALQDIVSEDKDQVLAPGHNLGQVVELGSELIVEESLEASQHE